MPEAWGLLTVIIYSYRTWVARIYKTKEGWDLVWRVNYFTVASCMIFTLSSAVLRVGCWQRQRPGLEGPRTQGSMTANMTHTHKKQILAIGPVFPHEIIFHYSLQVAPWLQLECTVKCQYLEKHHWDDQCLPEDLFLIVLHTHACVMVRGLYIMKYSF